MHQLGLVLLSNFRCVSLLSLLGGSFRTNQWRSRTRPASGSKVLLVALTQHPANTISWAVPSFVLLAFTSSRSLSRVKPFLRVFNTNADSRLFIRYCLDFLVNMTLLLLRRARWRTEPLLCSVRCVLGTDQTWTPPSGVFIISHCSQLLVFSQEKETVQGQVYGQT